MRGIEQQRKEITMWSIWNAPSDLDYYSQSGFSEEEPEQEEETEPEPPDDELGEQQ